MNELPCSLSEGVAGVDADYPTQELSSQRPIRWRHDCSAPSVSSCGVAYSKQASSEQSADIRTAKIGSRRVFVRSAWLTALLVNSKSLLCVANTLTVGGTPSTIQH